jgi:parallel beta-helix repeat protein
MRKNDLIKKTLILWIIMLFFCSTSISLNASFVNNNSTNHVINITPQSRASTIYVDDDNTEGPWDGTIDHPYQYIQDGVDNAVEGDTVYVFNGNYIENVWIYNSISLVGENREGTLIDANSTGSCLNIESNNVNVSKFTLKNSGDEEWSDAGIHLGSFNNDADYCRIIGNKIIDNFDGIYSFTPGYNLFQQNTIIDNRNIGINLHGSGGNGYVKIVNNTIINSTYSGICVFDSPFNKIYENLIDDNGVYGIYIYTEENSIFKNTIKNHIYGINNSYPNNQIYMNSIKDNNIGLINYNSFYNTIRNNNFIDNNNHATFDITLKKSNTNWFGNYWKGHSANTAKVIEGKATKNIWLYMIYLAWEKLLGTPPFPKPELEKVNSEEYDWFPSKTPYDIQNNSFYREKRWI